MLLRETIFDVASQPSPPLITMESPLLVRVVLLMEAVIPVRKKIVNALPAARQLLNVLEFQVNGLPLKYEQFPTISEFSITVFACTLTWLPALPSKRERLMVIDPFPS